LRMGSLSVSAADATGLTIIARRMPSGVSSRDAAPGKCASRYRREGRARWTRGAMDATPGVWRCVSAAAARGASACAARSSSAEPGSSSAGGLASELAVGAGVLDERLMGLRRRSPIRHEREQSSEQHRAGVRDRTDLGHPRTSERVDHLHNRVERAISRSAGPATLRRGRKRRKRPRDNLLFANCRSDGHHARFVSKQTSNRTQIRQLLRNGTSHAGSRRPADGDVPGRVPRQLSQDVRIAVSALPLGWRAAVR
jgi:hypothetical protein